jgi:hypothetical protein
LRDEFLLPAVAVHRPSTRRTHGMIDP